MRKFLSGLWKVITFPFRAVFAIIAFPFRGISRFRKFMNTEPEDHPLVEVFVGLTTDQKTRAMLWEQVEEFRKHLLRSLLVMMLAVGGAFFFTHDFMEVLARPIGGLEKLTSVDMTESISVFMIVALFLGVAAAVPYIAFELWLFAAPGLRPREKKIGLAGIPLTLLFFLGGVAFTYYIMLPSAIPFLVDFMGMKTTPRPQSYFSLVTGLMFWIGLSFEFPLVIYVLTAVGFIKPRVLAEQWKVAIVVISIVAAVITPTVDPVNQGLVMAPMIVLYFVSIGLSYLAYAGRGKAVETKEE